MHLMKLEMKNGKDDDEEKTFFHFFLLFSYFFLLFLLSFSHLQTLKFLLPFFLLG